MSEDAMIYKGWPYDQPDPESFSRTEQDVLLYQEQAEIDHVDELDRLRGTLVRMCQSGFCGSGTTVDQLLHAIDMTIGPRPV